MLNAQCSMLNAQCSMLNAQCSMKMAKIWRLGSTRGHELQLVSRGVRDKWHKRAGSWGRAGLEKTGCFPSLFGAPKLT